jgi:hypothetical protein
MEAAVPEVELQQELQRFATQFADRITQATEVLEGAALSGVRDEALRKNLLYVSSAMEIATGPFAEINLLDMIVFVRLSRSVLERYWIPQLYGSAGRDLAEVFERSDHELAEVAERVLTAEQRTQLTSLVETWLAENPDQARVEGIRLADFSSAAGSAAAERAARTKGLLASVRSASRAANQALLLSERGLFLFHRLPFLWRLQARLGVRQVLGDMFLQLGDGPNAPIGRLTRQVQRLLVRSLVTVGVLGGAAGLLWWLVSPARRRSRLALR